MWNLRFTFESQARQPAEHDDERVERATPYAGEIPRPRTVVFFGQQRGQSQSRNRSCPIAQKGPWVLASFGIQTNLQSLLEIKIFRYDPTITPCPVMNAAPLFIFDYFAWVRSRVPTMERSLRPLN